MTVPTEVKRVLALAYHFPPIGGGGVQRNAKFVRYLPEAGYEPIVVTGSGRTTYRWSPTDESLQSEIPTETDIRRVPGPEPPSSSGRRSALERRLMLKSPFLRWWVEGAVAIAGPPDVDVDLVYGSIVPYDSAEAAARIARNLGKPWVADLQDPWALDEMWIYPSALHRRWDLAKMGRHLRSADAIVMNTHEAATRLRAHFPELESKLVTAIPNGFDPVDFDLPAAPRNDGRFRIVHSGYLHTDVGFRLRDTSRIRRAIGGTAAQVDVLTRSHVYLLRAIEGLIERDRTVQSKIQLVLAGVMSESDRAISEQSVANVEMPGYMSHADTIALLKSADLLFLPMHDLPPGTRAGLVPGKTYEYLAAGPPILAAVPDGDARDLLAEAGNAFLCRPADSDAMAEVLRAQISRWQAGLPAPKARPEVLERYERRHLTRELASVFDAVLAEAPKGRDSLNGRRAKTVERQVFSDTPSQSASD